MALSFSAQVKKWSEKTKRNAELILRQSTSDVIGKMTTPQKSVKETGGTFEIGKLPVDTGKAINSLVVELSNGASHQGSQGYDLAIAGMKLGDSVSAYFAGGSSSYIRALEYGTANMQGRFFVREAALQWQNIVDENVRKIGE